MIQSQSSVDDHKDSASRSTDIKRKAVLVGLNLKTPRAEYDASMEELSRLAEALDLDVAASLVQNAPSVTQKTFIGSGKVHELMLTVEDCDADVVIFNEQLTPMQVRNLEDALDTEVLDRTGIILQIFSERARTTEARLQVASARLSYMLPRLAGMRRNLSRQGGGSGRLSNKGAGEEKLELDRRHIEHQLEEIRRQLSDVDRERTVQRAGRLKSGLPRVSLVGYTNAGKSTLMNRFLDLSQKGREDKQVLEEDMLFATLDTQVRKIRVQEHRPFLLSDTVGFISNLPHSLVKAFRSTLEEVTYADLLLEVVDYSDPAFERQIRVTRDTLQEIGAGDIPIIYIYNKSDKVEGVHIPIVHGDRIYMSAGEGIGMETLLDLIDTSLSQGQVTQTFLIPYKQGGLFSALRDRYSHGKEEYLPEGIKVSITLPQKDAKRLSDAEGVKVFPKDQDSQVTPVRA